MEAVKTDERDNNDNNNKKRKKEKKKTEGNFSDYRSRLISWLSPVIVTLLNKDLLPDDDVHWLQAAKINFSPRSTAFPS